MGKISDLWFDSTVLPLRLIDLQSTLDSKGSVCFRRSTDWNFHVISHTWSQDIRDLSVAVGKALSTSCCTNDNDDDNDLFARATRYNNAFAQQQFAEESSYRRLMDFFLVLVGDGASYVWFDALCINQTDDDEKSHEICHMGAYYRLSEGCYVITHGIGSELGFRAADPTKMTVPRWFTRAWTIQEAFLPRKLSFVVERFDAGVIKKSHPKKSFISALCDEWIDWDEQLESTVTSDNSRRRVYKELYCLGPQAYRRMMQVAIHAACYWALFDDAFGDLGIHEMDLQLLIELVQKRHCSVEEDRVLCLLGMLGLKGDYQLRTKQTLDQQLRALAHMLMKEKPELLINLCASDFEGYGKTSISWLPDLRHAEYRRFWGRHRWKNYVVERYEARVKEVQDNGRILLTARTLRGCLIKRGHRYILQLGALSEELGCHFKQQASVLSLNKRHTVDPQDGEVRQSGGFSIPACGIEKLDDDSSFRKISVCEIALLLLGHCHPCHYPRSLAMACVSVPEEEEMHKIGILVYACLDDQMFPASPEDCLIGGFGNDLTRFLSKDCQAVIHTG